MCPAARPLVQVISVLAFLVSSGVILIGIFGEPARDPHRTAFFLAGRRIEALTKAVERYRQDCGEYPPADEGLKSLVVNYGVAGWHGPYLEEILLDPWNRPYVYQPSAGSAAPEILSYGVDAKPGGEFMDADISSRNPLPVIPETPYELRSRRRRMGVWVGGWFCLLSSIVALKRSSRRRKGSN
jgi:type II secretion system protein G